jgi:hypothetical protein
MQDMLANNGLLSEQLLACFREGIRFVDAYKASDLLDSQG